MSEKNGYVRYPFFIGTMLGCMGTMISIIGLLYVVSSGKFDQFEKRVDGNFKVIREDIRGLRK
jgi:cell division protein FtsX